MITDVMEWRSHGHSYRLRRKGVDEYLYEIRDDATGQWRTLPHGDATGSKLADAISRMTKAEADVVSLTAQSEAVSAQLEAALASQFSLRVSLDEVSAKVQHLEGLFSRMLEVTGQTLDSIRDHVNNDILLQPMEPEEPKQPE